MAGGRNEQARERRRNQLKKHRSCSSVPRSETSMGSMIHASRSQVSFNLNKNFGWEILRKAQAGDGSVPNLTIFLEKPDSYGKNFQKVTHVLYIDELANKSTGPKSTQTSSRDNLYPVSSKKEIPIKKTRSQNINREKIIPFESDEIQIKPSRKEGIICKTVEQFEMDKVACLQEILSRSKNIIPQRDELVCKTKSEFEREKKELIDVFLKGTKVPNKKGGEICKTVEEFGRDKVLCLEKILSGSKNDIPQRDEIVCKTKSEFEREKEELIDVFLKGAHVPKKKEGVICKTIEEFEREKVESLNEYLIGSKSNIPQKYEVVCKTKPEFDKEKEDFIEDVLKAASRSRSKSKSKKGKKSGGGCFGKKTDAESTDDEHKKDGKDKKDKTDKDNDKPKKSHRKPNKWALRAGAEARNSFVGVSKNIKFHTMEYESSGDEDLEKLSTNNLNNDLPSEILLEASSGNNHYRDVSQAKYKKLKPLYHKLLKTSKYLKQSYM